LAHLLVGEPGQGVVGLDPTAGETANIAAIAHAITGAGVSDPTRTAFYEEMGEPTVLRDISYISWEDYIKHLELA
jgi:hypothetical protein